MVLALEGFLRPRQSYISRAWPQRALDAKARQHASMVLALEGISGKGNPKWFFFLFLTYTHVGNDAQELNLQDQTTALEVLLLIVFDEDVFEKPSEKSPRTSDPSVTDRAQLAGRHQAIRSSDSRTGTTAPAQSSTPCEQSMTKRPSSFRS